MRYRFLVVGDDVISLLLASRLQQSGPTLLIRSWAGSPLMEISHRLFPLLPPFSLQTLLPFSTPATGILIHSAFQNQLHPPAVGLKIQGDLLTFFRHLEQVFPQQATVLASLHQDFFSRYPAFPPHLHEYPLRQIFEPFSIYFSHLPLLSLSFLALRKSFQQFSPSLLSLGEFTRTIEREFRKAGGEIAESTRVHSFLYRGVFPSGVSTVDGEPRHAHSLFFGNSPFLHQRLKAFSTGISPFLGYGILKTPLNPEVSFIFRIFDRDFPPVEQNFFFAFLLPWVKGEAEYPEIRVIFGYFSREDHWAGSGEKVEKRYRATLLEAVSESVGQVEILQFLTPLEVRNHSLFYTFPTPTYLPGEISLSRRMKFRSAFPPACRLLISPEMMTGEAGAWILQAERLALPYLKVPM